MFSYFALVFSPSLKFGALIDLKIRCKKKIIKKCVVGLNFEIKKGKWASMLTLYVVMCIANNLDIITS